MKAALFGPLAVLLSALRSRFALLLLLLSRAFVVGACLTNTVAHATLLAYDGFDYGPAGSDLQGNNGGFGFSSGWSAGGFNATIHDNYNLASGSPGFGSLATSGNSVVTPSVAGFSGLTRSLTSSLGTPGTTVYLSFLIEPRGTLSAQGHFGILFESPAEPEVFMGKSGVETQNEYVIENRGGDGQFASGVSTIIGQTALIVVRVEFGLQSDTFTMYVNPTPGAAEPASGVVKIVDIGTVAGLTLYSTDAHALDDLRLGETFADVTPVSLPGISLRVGPTTIASGGNFNYAATELGQQRNATFTITNTGTAALTSIAASIAPAGGGDFVLGSTPATTIEAGASGTFSVVFSPQALGSRTATLNVVSNATPSPYLIQLSGSGVDTTVPVITSPAFNLTVLGGAANTASLINSWLSVHGGAAATDNSGAVTWSHNYTSPPLPGSSATITFTASDASGNQSTSSAQLIVLDQTPPAINPQAANLTIVDGVASNPATLNTWLTNHGGASATDNSGAFTWSHNYTSLPVPGTQVTITFTAGDASGNQSTTTAQLILLDQTPPVVTVQAAPLTVVCDDPDKVDMINAWLAAHGTAAATDNSGATTWTHNFTSIPGACGTATISFKATDPSGNFSTSPALLTVVDNTAPVITVPASGTTVESDGNGNVAARTAWLNSHGGANATDNCGPLTWSHNFTGLANTLPQTIPVTFSAKDACDLSATTAASFVIQDTTPPQVTVPALDFYGDCDDAAADIAAFLAGHGSAQIVDIAGPVTWTHNFAGTLPECEHYITVTFTATDTVGLSASTSARFFLFPPGAIWIGPAAGTWTTASGWRSQVPTLALDAYVDLFDFQNTTLTVPTGSHSTKNLFIGPGDVLSIGGTGITYLELYGNTIGNAGQLRIQGARLYINGATSLTGAGQVILSGTGGNHIDRGANSTADVLTVSAGQEIITTADTEGEYQHTAIHAGIVNYGTVTADAGGLTLYQNPKTNHALFRAVNGGTLRMEVPINNADGTLSAGAGSTLKLEDTLTGGSVTGTGRLLINTAAGLTGPLTLESGLTTAVEGGGTAKLTGNIINDSQLLLSVPGGSSAILSVNGAVTLDGSGKVILQDAGNRRIMRANSLLTDVLTVGAAQEITTTAGTIAEYQNAAIHAGIVNFGTITADQGGLTLYQNPKTNHALFRAINGGTLRMEVPINNADGTLSAGAGSTLKLEDTLTGGSVAGTGRLLMNTTAGFTGPLTLESGLTTAVEGGNTEITGNIINDSQLLIGFLGGSGATVSVNGAVTLDGNGKIVLQGAGNRRILRANSSVNDVLTVGAAQEITTTAGTIAEYQRAAIHAGLVNHGTITANQGGLLLYQNPKTNNATFRAINGGSLVIASSLLTNYNAATDTLTGGRYEVVSAGTPTVMDIQSSPIATIAAGTTVRLSGAAASLPQLSGLTNITGTLMLENGKTLTTTGNMSIPGTLQFGLPTALEITRLAITGNVNFTGTRVDVLDLGLATGSYLLATWTGTLTGAPVLGSLPQGSQHSLVLDPVAKTLRLEVFVIPQVDVTTFTIVPGTGPNAGQDVVTLAGTGHPGAGYIIEASMELVTWVPVSPVLTSPNGALTWEFTQSPALSRRFYRFLLQ